jgi:hypothetical protein
LHWGTKWNAHRVTVDELKVAGDEARVVIHFSTPWTAPTPVVRKASEMYPQLRMDLSYAEETQKFTGQLVCKGGKALFHECDPYWELCDEEEFGQQSWEDPSIPPDDRLDAYDEVIGPVRRDRADDALQQAKQETRGGQSCRTFPAREPGSMVLVGWDRELQTYFGQVWQVSRDASLSFRTGEHHGEVPSVFALAALLQRFAKIPAATLVHLHGEPLRQGPPGQPHETGRDPEPPESSPRRHHPKLRQEF